MHLMVWPPEGAIIPHTPECRYTGHRIQKPSWSGTLHNASPPANSTKSEGLRVRLSFKLKAVVVAST